MEMNYMCYAVDMHCVDMPKNEPLGVGDNGNTGGNWRGRDGCDRQFRPMQLEPCKNNMNKTKESYKIIKK